MSSLSIASLVFKNVNVTPNIFELKKCDGSCVAPSARTRSHCGIIFGALANVDVESIVTAEGDNCEDVYRWVRDFNLGNYSISVVNFNQQEAKPVVIFHHENLDPILLATALLYCKRKDNNEKGSAALNSCSYKKSRNKHRDGNDDTRAQTTSKLVTKLKLGWKVDPGDVENSADFWTPRLDDLFYFLNSSVWFDCYYDSCESPQVEISALTSGFYQLQAKNQRIGLAMNPREVFGDTAVSGILILRDPLKNCFALVLHGFVEQGYREFAKLDLPKESFLYENVYRSFYKCGEEIENPYYGNDGNNEFSRLPDTVFVNILSYLPWRQRIQCRRVNQQWRTVSTLATAIDTKVINLSNQQYNGMRSEDLNFVLPIVSNHLEEFIWSNSLKRGGIFNFEGVGQVPQFPKLREIYINEQTPDFDGFFSMLNKCPNLKELTAPIPKRPSSSIFTPGPYVTVEKLCIPNSGSLTDPWLIEITDYFPNLTSLRICGYEFLSSSCISAVAEKYGETLTRLEIWGRYDKHFSRLMVAASTIGAVTGFGSCPNLEYLSLIDTVFISNTCMRAIAAGCAQLTTLDVNGSGIVTNKALVALASLPNLVRLNLSVVGCLKDLSFGIGQLAKAGHLEQLLVKNTYFPSPACLKTCVRFCRQLKLVDMSGSNVDLTIDDATEIIQLYGTWGLRSRLIFRSNKRTWREQAVRTAQDEVTERFNRRFIVAPPQYRSASKWAPEDDSDPAANQCVHYSENDFEDEDDSQDDVDNGSDDSDYDFWLDDVSDYSD